MKRAISLVVNACLIAGISPKILAQDVTNPSPEPPSSHILGTQLIAWSALQKPQPLDQPVSESDRSQRPSPQRDRAVSPSGQQRPAPAAWPDPEKKDKPQENK
ncbi:MAG: hypothetical protein WB762_06560 [Candidatus Sulfotelmatobacter sp.]